MHFPSTFTRMETVNSLEADFYCRRAVQYLWRPRWIINGLLQFGKISHKTFCEIGTKCINTLPRSIAGIISLCKNPQWGINIYYPLGRGAEMPVHQGLGEGVQIFNSNVIIWFVKHPVLHQMGNFQHIFSQVGSSLPASISWAAVLGVGSMTINKELKKRCHQSMRQYPQNREALYTEDPSCILYPNKSY